MIIPSSLLTDTELCQLVFDLIEMTFDVSKYILNTRVTSFYIYIIIYYII